MFFVSFCTEQVEQSKNDLYILGSLLDLPVIVMRSQWCFPPTKGPLSVHAWWVICPIGPANQRIVEPAYCIVDCRISFLDPFWISGHSGEFTVVFPADRRATIRPCSLWSLLVGGLPARRSPLSFRAQVRFSLFMVSTLVIFCQFGYFLLNWSLSNSFKIQQSSI